MNTRSGPTASIETLAIVPPTPPTSPYTKKSDLKNNFNYIQSGIKADIKSTNNTITSTNSNTTAINDNIAAMIAIFIDTKGNQDKK